MTGPAVTGRPVTDASATGPAVTRRPVPGRPLVTGGAWAPRLARAGPALVGLALGLLAVGPGLGRGFLLSYDMVFVPSPPVSAVTFGLAGGPPRAVPSDAVVAAASSVVPGDILQKLILILIFVLACSGAAALVGGPLPARLAAGVYYAWNPFVAERLIIGQWALLLGYAGLPWVLRSLCRGPVRVRPTRLMMALIPAAIGGFAPMTVSAIVAGPAALARGDALPRVGARARRLGAVLLVLAVLSLPWVIPALLIGVHTDPRGVAAFTARADTPFGRLGSLLMLGGSWNAQTVPRGYGGPASAAWLVLAGAAIAGYILGARRQRRCPGLGVAALTGLAIAVVGIIPFGRLILMDLIRIWPAFAVLRDGQQYLAPLALAEAVGFGAAVTWVVRDLPAPSARRAAGALGVMAVLAPLLFLPGLGWGAAGRLRPVGYPADWARARQLIDDDRGPGSALVLPWATYRRYPWNHGEAVYDPWPLLLSRRVILNDALQVGRQTLAAEDPEARRADRIIAAPGPLTGRLRAAGVRYVIVDAGPLLGQPAATLAARARLPGAAVVLASPDLIVYRLPLLPPTPLQPRRQTVAEYPLTGCTQPSYYSVFPKVTIGYIFQHVAESRRDSGHADEMSDSPQGAAPGHEPQSHARPGQDQGGSSCRV